MAIDWIVVGLIFDVVGFVLVFLFGGFSIGSSTMAFEDSRPKTGLRITGAIFVVLGFALQIYGNLT